MNITSLLMLLLILFVVLFTILGNKYVQLHYKLISTIKEKEKIKNKLDDINFGRAMVRLRKLGCIEEV